MAIEGAALGNRVTSTSTSRIDAAVVYQVLNVPTLWARFNRKGMAFNKPTMKKSVKISRTNLGQSYIGLEALNSSASDTLIQLEYAHNAYTHPRVKIMLEHFANEGAGEDINLGDFIDQEALAEMNSDLGTLVYGTGAGKDILGLEALIDDATNTTTFGGQLRATYTNLNSTVTAASAITLAKMAVMIDTISDSGDKQQTTFAASRPTEWSLMEQLLHPTIRNNYTMGGFDNLGLGDSQVMRGGQKSLGGMLGFTAFTYRGIPFIRDKHCTDQVIYYINENYIDWYGRTSVPNDFRGHVERIKLGKSSTVDTKAFAPSDFHGWFSQKEQMMPNQAGLIARYHCIGQMVGWSGRRQGKHTGVTTVA